MWYLDVNSVKTDLLILSSLFHIHSILKLAPVLSKIGENTFGAHFLQLYRKNQFGDPHFLFHDFDNYSASFRWEKNLHKSMFTFLASLLNYTDWAIMGQIALNSRICQHCDVKTSTVTPTFYYFFYHLLNLLHQCTKFYFQSMLGSVTLKH